MRRIQPCIISLPDCAIAASKASGVPWCIRAAILRRTKGAVNRGEEDLG
jgi:hypothetical protein